MYFIPDLKKILYHLAKLDVTLNTLATKVSEIQIAQEDFFKHHSKLRDSHNDTFNELLPLKTIEEFKEFEKKIQESRSFSKDVVSIN